MSASEQFKKYLQDRTGSAKCPFCGHDDWVVRGNSNGQVARSKVLDQSFVDELNQALYSATRSLSDPNYHSSENSDTDMAANILGNIAIVKCQHCGYIAFFDRKTMGYLND